MALVLFPVTSMAAGDPLKKMAKELGKSLVQIKGVRVGILAFPHHDGKVSSGSTIVSERLTTYLATTKGIYVVERGLIQKLLEEQHLMDVGVLDSKTAKKLGHVLGVDVIVSGTLIDMGDNKIEVNARGIRSDSGAVVAASQAVIERTWKDRAHKPGDESREMRIEQPEPVKEKPNEEEAIEIGYPASGGGRPGRPARGGRMR